MGTQPTNIQIKEFWEWCGLVEQPTGSWYVDNVAGEYVSSGIPKLDLNNLFKYAVPKLNINDRIEISWSPVKGYRDYNADVVIWRQNNVGLHHKWTEHENPALALFWTIWEIIILDNIDAMPKKA